MIAKNVVFTKDSEGCSYYVPEDKLSLWESLVNEYGRDGEDMDTPLWAVKSEGKSYVVDIKEEL